MNKLIGAPNGNAMKGNHTRKIRVCVFVIVGAIVLANVGMCLADYFREISPEEQLLRSSIEEIKKYLLVITPIGLNMEDVMKVIESHDAWEIWQISHEHGPDYSSGVGEKYIRTHIGQYRENCKFGIGVTGVVVWWAFNEDAELVDIFVRKDTDAL